MALHYFNQVVAQLEWPNLFTYQSRKLEVSSPFLSLITFSILSYLSPKMKSKTYLFGVSIFLNDSQTFRKKRFTKTRVICLSSIEKPKAIPDIGQSHEGDILQRRLAEHNAGLNISTAPRRPLTLIYFEGHIVKEDALRRESYFKTSSGKRTLQIILKQTLNDLGYQQISKI